MIGYIFLIDFYDFLEKVLTSTNFIFDNFFCFIFVIFSYLFFFMWNCYHFLKGFKRSFPHDKEECQRASSAVIYVAHILSNGLKLYKIVI